MKISDLKNYTVLGNESSVGDNAPIESAQPPKSLGQKILDVGTGISNFFGGKGISDLAGATIAKVGASKEAKPFVEFPKAKEVVGSALQLGANFIPGVGELKGVGTLAKVGIRTAEGLGAGYALDVGSQLQDKNKSVGEALKPGLGTVTGGSLPVVGGAIITPAKKIVGRLLKGLGSGLSGVSADTINKIVSNPETALKASKILAKSGNDAVLENNARTLMNGVGKIQKKASTAYQKGLDTLSKVDINPDNLKQGFFSALKKNKINVSPEGKIDFTNADFLDPKIQQKAETLINTVNQHPDLTGTGVRKLLDIVDNARFKTAPDGERQAFNAFIGDLKQGLKDGISASTNKLDKINAKYSADMQLSEAAQNIFGNVNFKNLSEVAKAANRLEGLFSEKGLDPKIIDDYLQRIGVNPADFKTTEAVRQISNKQASANSVGTSVGEVVRSVTSAVITPQIVKNLSIATGMSKEKIAPFLRSLKPSARNIVIQALLQDNQGNSGQ